MKTEKFTFKTEKPTGKFASFDTPRHLIKLEGKCVGNIAHCEKHTICLSVIKAYINEDGNPNCIFKNIRLKVENDTLDAAKKWLNDNFDAVVKLNLYKLY